MATTREHIYPQSVKRYGNNETVRACKECNCALGAYAPFDLEERVQFLIERQIRKFGLNKPRPEWDDEEIDELGASLRRRIIAKIHAHQRAINRALYMEGVLRVLIKTSHLPDLDAAMRSVEDETLDVTFRDE